MYGYESFKVNLAMEVEEKDWVIVTSPRYCGLSVLRTPNEGRQMTVRYDDSWLYLFTSSSFYFVTCFCENFLSVFLAVTRFLKNFPSVLLALFNNKNFVNEQIAAYFYLFQFQGS